MKKRRGTLKRVLWESENPEREEEVNRMESKKKNLDDTSNMTENFVLHQFLKSQSSCQSFRLLVYLNILLWDVLHIMHSCTAFLLFYRLCVFMCARLCVSCIL